MKKGFTLIELLAVIIILAVIALIATPIVLNVVDNAKESARKSSVAGFADAVKLARTEAQFNNLPFNDNDLSDLSVETNTNNVTCGVIRFTTTDGIILNNCTVQEETNYCYKKGTVEKGENCETLLSDVSQEPIVINPNEPDLLDNMIPIKYVTDHWVYADINSEWYNYNNKEWANAVVLNSGVNKTVGQTISESEISLWYVWIPRYKYTIFNGNNETKTEQIINVIFESETSTTGTVKCHDNFTSTASEVCEDTTQTNNAIVNGKSTYTHPAFCLGDKNSNGDCSGEELTGIWVGKFENTASITNLNEIQTILIKPNVNSWRVTSVSNFYTSIKNASTTYGIANGDSHMMKNMEWGAVAYLKQSQFGLGLTDIGINNYRANDTITYKTGCGATAGSNASDTCNAYDTTDGIKASTTGNIYGIYDMSGGSWEYLMGNMSSSNSSFIFNNSGAEFTTNPETKYYDKYTYDTSNTSYTRGKLGDATKEILTDINTPSNGGWYNDAAYLIQDTTYIGSWFVRSGHYDQDNNAGIFHFSYVNGDRNTNMASRAVLSRKTIN